MLLQSDVFVWNEQFERLERAELAALQLKQLRAELDRAAAAVPFHAERLRRAGLSGPALSSLEDLRRLPLTSKADLRDHYPFGLLCVDRTKLSRLHASSGTRGKPTIAAYTQADIRNWAELCARCLTAVGVRQGDVVQNAYGYGLFTGGLGLHYGAEHLGATVVPASSGRTQQQIMLLSDLGARALCCTPSYALNIASTLRETPGGHAPLKLEIGIFGAEPWTQECRRQIEQALNIKAYDIYGLSEVLGPGVAVECAAQSGLHIWEDHFLFEIIDPQSGEPCKPGEPGELVITTLQKEAAPLFRYRTGDRCALIEEPCPCGRTSRRITRIQGRLDDMLIIRGVNVYPSEIESILYCAEELSAQYQIIIERAQAMDSLVVKAELSLEQQQKWRNEKCEAEQRRALELRIIDGLHQRLGLTALVQVLDASSLPRSEGKAMHVLDTRNLGQE